MKTETLHVEEPGYRRNCPKFTAEQADKFLATWCRVAAADGSTVAYCPDIETAQAFASLSILDAALDQCVEALEALVTARISHVNPVEFYDAVELGMIQARAALDAAKKAKGI